MECIDDSMQCSDSDLTANLHSDAFSHFPHYLGSGAKKAAAVSSREQGGGQSKLGNLGIQTKLAQGMEVDGCSLSNARGYAKCMGGNPPKPPFLPGYRGDNPKEGKWESKAKAKPKTKKPAQGMEAEGCRQSKACGNAKCMGGYPPQIFIYPLG